MKIRQGFVSNSSSTSFCIYGRAFDMESSVVDNLLSKFPDMVDHYNECEKNDEIWEFYDDIESRIDNNDQVTFYYDLDQQAIYIGNHARQILDTETGAEFKARTVQSIKEYFPDTEIDDCSYICTEIGG